MKIEDAAKILNITGEITSDDVRKAYKRASTKYHPDKGGSVEMMQAVNEAYQVLKNFEGNIDAGDLNYPEELNEALLKIIDLPGIEIEVCGSWVWVTGDTKPHKEALGRDGAGFTWARKKKAWYFRPSDWKSSSRGGWSLDKIRETHGSEKVKAKAQKKLSAAAA